MYATKGDTLDGMVDLVFAEIGRPPTDTDWKTAMRHRATSAREVLARHPWAIGLTEVAHHARIGQATAPRRGNRLSTGRPASRS